MQYLNTKTNAYETAAEHFGYRFDHDKSNCVAWSYEGLEDYADENGVDIDKMIADGIIEVDYENGNWYIDPDDDSIIWNYLIDDDNDDDEDDDIIIHIDEMRTDEKIIQTAIDTKAHDIAFVTGDDKLQNVVRVYEDADIYDEESTVEVRIGWSSIGAVTIDEAEKFVRILQTAIHEAKQSPCVGCKVTYDKEKATYWPCGGDVIDNGERLLLDPFKHMYAYEDEDNDDDIPTEEATAEDENDEYARLYDEFKADLDRDYETGRELAYYIDAEEPDIEVEDINRIVDEMVRERNRIIEQFNDDVKADLDHAVMLDHNSYVLTRAALELEFWNGTARENEEADDDDEELPF